MTLKSLVVCWGLSLLLVAQTSSKQAERVAPQRKGITKASSESPYQKWVEQDAGYIISNEERQAFKHLNTDEERAQFIEQFWRRRDPTPDTIENEFQEEHYRRIAYANEHFGSDIPGWKSDRGRIYITFGPPDEIEAHPSGVSYARPPEEGGGRTSTYPFEKWRYRYIEGVGTDVVIEFVDRAMSGEYRMLMDPSETEALLMAPGTRPAMLERSLANRAGVHTSQLPAYARPPAVQFKELEAVVNSHIHMLPMKVRTDFLHLTDATTQALVTVQFANEDLQSRKPDGSAKTAVNMYMRITSLTGRVVSVQERAIPAESVISQEALFLAPGAYRLKVAAKDVASGKLSTYDMALDVPRFEEDKLAASNIILGDGSTKMRPRVSESFNRDEKLRIYCELYNLGADQKTHKPSGTVEYEVVRDGPREKVIDFTEDVNSVPNASARQVTIEKLLPLTSLRTGQYVLGIKVSDNLKRQVLTRTAAFSVN